MTTPAHPFDLSDAERIRHSVPSGGPWLGGGEEMPTIIAAWTLGTWVTCLLVGLCGILVPYPRERPPSKVPPPLVVEKLETALVPDQETPVNPSPAGAPDVIPQPPAPPEPAPPLEPSLPSVSLPSPQIALAEPVEVPAQPVAPMPVQRPMPPAKPSPSASRSGSSAAGPAAASPPAVRHLTFGVGEGAQPSPDYPAAAVNAGEQGNVGIRFTVDESGKVVSVELASPSRWPLLNQSALHAIRERWRFTPGPIRRFDVVIQFQLNQQ